MISFLLAPTNKFISPNLSPITSLSIGNVLQLLLGLPMELFGQLVQHIDHFVIPATLF
jgi:hypothetical protein